MSLARSAACFVETYHAHRALVEEQRGWSLTVVLAARDTGEAVALRIVDGRVVGMREEREGTIVITADAATLRDILELARGPSEPYLFGELTVRGPEADFVRLDYIATVLCPA